MKVFAQEGRSFQQVGGEKPSGWVEMSSQRPELDYIAAKDGSWIPPKPITPASCTRRQGRLALLASGFLDDAEEAIAEIGDPIEKRTAQIEYETDTWSRENLFLQSLWSQIGGTDEQLDELFRVAAGL